jgi:flavin-dependent dehydrogenase
LKQNGSIKEMEKQVLYKNPFLKSLFLNSEFLFDRPETINEISFATKSPVHNHILMAGDAAGMITPLCGNGMALAIHSAKLTSELIIQYSQKKITRITLENDYALQWNNQFARRLWVGRQIQKLFGADWVSNLSVGIVNYAKPLATYLMKQTHGTPF